jgi:hypothetical protein
MNTFSPPSAAETGEKLLGDTAAVTALLDQLLISRSPAEMPTSQLAHEAADRFARRGGLEVERTCFRFAESAASTARETQWRNTSNQ